MDNIYAVTLIINKELSDEEDGLYISSIQEVFIGVFNSTLIIENFVKEHTKEHFNLDEVIAMRVERHIVNNPSETEHVGDWNHTDEKGWHWHTHNELHENLPKPKLNLKN